MGKKPDKKGMWAVKTSADLDAALDAEAELIHVAGMPETSIGVETPPDVQKLAEEPPKEQPAVVEVPEKKTNTTVVFTAKGEGAKDRKNTRTVNRDGMRPRFYKGNAPLQSVMYELFFENLGNLHDKIGDSMRDVLGDIFTGIVSEVEDNGETFQETEFRTPPYRVVVKERSLTVEPVSDGPETVGEVVKIHPGTKRALTQEEQRSLKRLRVDMDIYGKGGMPELPEGGYEPLERTEHEGLREYSAIQSLSYAVAKTAEREFGEDVKSKVGQNIVCRVLEIEYRGKRYRVNGLEMPAFRLVSYERVTEDEKTKEKKNEKYVWAEPIDPAYKGKCLGEIVMNPETGEKITVNEYRHLKAKVGIEKCYGDNPTPPTTRIRSCTKKARFDG